MAASLYIVATPIGNLEDMTARALRILRDVKRIYAEDTRVTQGLLTHFGIQNNLLSLHEHNEQQRLSGLVAALAAGDDIALVSDAGTPLISDPGYRVVREVSAAGFQVIPIPGASALIAALSVAGLPTDRFAFEGFLPAKPAARRQALKALQQEPRTLVFYESSHRIVGLLADMEAGLGAERHLVIARELSKLYEQVYRGTIAELRLQLEQDSNMRRGEFVVMVAGQEAATPSDEVNNQAQQLLQTLLAEGLPLKQTTHIAARLTGLPKNALYRQALLLSDVDDVSDSEAT